MATGGASGNPVLITIASSSSTVCAISSGTVSFTGVGTCTIDANQAGDTNYSAAPPATQSFPVEAVSTSCTIVWTGGTGDWTTTADWTPKTGPARLPNSSDTTCIPAPIGCDAQLGRSGRELRNAAPRQRRRQWHRHAERGRHPRHGVGNRVPRRSAQPGFVRRGERVGHRGQHRLDHGGIYRHLHRQRDSRQRHRRVDREQWDLHHRRRRHLRRGRGHHLGCRHHHQRRLPDLQRWWHLHLQRQHRPGTATSPVPRSRTRP